MSLWPRGFSIGTPSRKTDALIKKSRGAAAHVSILTNEVDIDYQK